MNKKANIVIGVFMSMLVLPAITYPFVKQYLDTNNYENRVLAERPNLDYTNILDFPSLYEGYFNDHIPYKNELVGLNHYTSWKFFQTIDHHQVILGKDGWFFYVPGVEAYEDITLYTEEELQQILHNLKTLQGQAEEVGAEFVLMITPDKPVIYEKYLPDYYKKGESDNKYQQVMEFLKDEGTITLVDPSEALLGLQGSEPIYYKYDSHWNVLGGYYGAMELLKSLGMNGDHDIVYRPFENNENMDLGYMVMLMKYLEGNTDYEITEYLEDVSWSEVKTIYSGEEYKKYI